MKGKEEHIVLAPGKRERNEKYQEEIAHKGVISKETAQNQNMKCEKQFSSHCLYMLLIKTKHLSVPVSRKIFC